MATILRGKRRGEEAKIIQWCNDWIMIEPATIVSPTSLRLDAKEVMDVRNHKNNGIMFNLFELNDDGMFKRRKRRCLKE